MSAVSGDSFGGYMRSSREHLGLSMSAVARAIGVSIVYYRDVESGNRRPFSSLKIDFSLLATILGADASRLLHLAALERGQLEFDFKTAGKDERALVVHLAQLLHKKTLGKANLRRLRLFLRRVS